MNAGTPLGLGFASGVNAYLPLLAFAAAVRWLHLYTINSHFAFITSDWFMILLAILTLLDFVADKIPLLDHGWDAINTAIRPLAGALVAAASSQQVVLPMNTASLSSSLLFAPHGVAGNAGNIPSTGVELIVMALLGGMLAALAHTTKASVRLISTVTTAGFFNVILSFCEDVLVVVCVLIALFVPAIMLILVILFVLFAGPRVLRLWHGQCLKKRVAH
jgi:hypothetical protein